MEFLGVLFRADAAALMARSSPRAKESPHFPAFSNFCNQLPVRQLTCDVCEEIVKSCAIGVVGYEGTVMERRFVVPFSHCLCRVQKAVFGLCGQGSCFSLLFCCSVALAPC